MGSVGEQSSEEDDDVESDSRNDKLIEAHLKKQIKDLEMQVECDEFK
jgi:hypothetical protein